MPTVSKVIRVGDGTMAHDWLPDTEAGSSGPTPVTNMAGSRAFGGVEARFRARADSIDVWSNTHDRWIALLKDGVRQGAAKADSSTSWRWIAVGTGLDDGSEHQWSVVSGGSGAELIQAQSVRIDGTSAAFSATAPTALAAPIFAIGDSITEAVGDSGAVGGTEDDNTLGWTQVLARSLFRPALVWALSGTTTQDHRDTVAAALAACPTAPCAVLIHSGRNNVSDSRATVAAAYQTLLENALAGCTCPVLAIQQPLIGAFPAVNLGIGDAVTAVASSRVTLVDGSGWSDVTSNNGNTSAHYDVAGHATFADHLTPSVAALLGSARRLVIPYGAGGRLGIKVA